MSTKSTPQSKNNEVLCAAAAAGDTAAVQRLLTAGADVHALDDAPLLYAAGNGHTDTVRLLLAAGADVHVEDDTPLYDAADAGHADTCAALLAAGANPLRAFPRDRADLLTPGAAAALDAAIMDACPDLAGDFRAAFLDAPLPRIDAHLAAHDVRNSLQRPAPRRV